MNLPGDPRNFPDFPFISALKFPREDARPGRRGALLNPAARMEEGKFLQASSCKQASLPQPSPSCHREMPALRPSLDNLQSRQQNPRLHSPQLAGLSWGWEGREGEVGGHQFEGV